MSFWIIPEESNTQAIDIFFKQNFLVYFVNDLEHLQSIVYAFPQNKYFDCNNWNEQGFIYVDANQTVVNFS